MPVAPRRADSRGVRCTRWGYRENRTTSEQKSRLCVLKECARLSSLILAITVPWEVKARCEITGTGSLHRRSACWKNLFYSFFVFLNLQQNHKVLHAVFTRARGRQQQLPRRFSRWFQARPAPHSVFHHLLWSGRDALNWFLS